MFPTFRVFWSFKFFWLSDYFWDLDASNDEVLEDEEKLLLEYLSFRRAWRFNLLQFFRFYSYIIIYVIDFFKYFLFFLLGVIVLFYNFFSAIKFIGKILIIIPEIIFNLVLYLIFSSYGILLHTNDESCGVDSVQIFFYI